MPQTLLLTVKSYDLGAGTNMTNPMGLMIRVAADQGGSTVNLRMYFFHPDADTPEIVGWRSLFDGALVLFLQRRDFASYLLMLDQAKATYFRVVLDDNDDIRWFGLSTLQFPALDRQLELTESDAAEFKKRTAKS